MAAHSLGHSASEAAFANGYGIFHTNFVESDSLCLYRVRVAKWSSSLGKTDSISAAVPVIRQLVR
jgi:hypothetical protein